MKRCPYCAEEIQGDAVFCRYCGHDTRVPVPAPVEARLTPDAAPVGSSGLEESWPYGASPGNVTPPQAHQVEPSSRSPSGGRTFLALLGIIGVLWGTGAALMLLAVIGGAGLTESTYGLATFAQLGFRCVIGSWAVQDRSFDKAKSALAKIGIFLLAFIPIGSWFALWYASRSAVRKGLTPALTIFTILLLAGAAVLVAPLLTLPSTAAALPPTSYAASVKAPTSTRIPTTPTRRPTKMSTPTLRPNPLWGSCLDPEQIDVSDKGKTVVVCGEVTARGTRACPSCPYGEYAYLTIDDSFTIISYDWVFTSGWKGRCVRVSDKVEVLGSNPVFVHGAGEGYQGSKCTREQNGELTCIMGDYFLSYSGCN